MQVAIIGAGTIFSSHAAAYRAMGIPIVAVVDVDRERVREAARRLDIPEALTDWRELLDRSDVAVVDVCTPAKFHAEIAVSALNAGKHVICEKPLAANLADVDRILEAESRGSGKLLVAHQLRCLPMFCRLKWLVEEGHLGTIHFARVQRYDPPPKDLVDRGVWGSWDLAGGGVLMTKAIHEIDMLLGLIGPARRVQAMMGTYLYAIESEDHLTANVEFASGAIANICVGAGAYSGQRQHFDLFGSLGAIGQPLNIRLNQKSAEAPLLNELKRRFPETPPPSDGALLLRRVIERFRGQAHRERAKSVHEPIFRRFFAALEGRDEVPVTGRQGRAAVELCTAIYTAALTGETVDLPLNQSARHYEGIQRNAYAGSK